MKIKFFTFGTIGSLIEASGGGNKSLLLLASELGNNCTVEIICFGVTNTTDNILFNNSKILIKEYKVSRLSLYFLTFFLPSLLRILKSEDDENSIFHFYNVHLDPLAGLYKLLNKNKKIISTLNSYIYISPNFECRLFSQPKYKLNFLERCFSIFDLFNQNFGFFVSVLLIPLTPFLSLLYGINIFLSKQIGQYTALSQTVKDIYVANGFKNIEIIPNMLDTSFNLSSKNVKKGKVILYVGRIKRSKGVGYLIGAFLNSSLFKKGYELRIVGDGNQLNLLKNKYDNIKSINFLGKIPYNKVSEEFNKAEIFVHPGIWPEPFGRTILEVIQSNCKILVSNIGEPPNIVKKDECIYLYNDVKELERKMKVLVESSSKGFADQEILNKYLPKKIIKQYMSIYNEL